VGVHVRLAQAEAAYLEAIAIKQRVLGDAHPETRVTAANLGNLRALTGQLTGSVAVQAHEVGGRLLLQAAAPAALPAKPPAESPAEAPAKVPAEALTEMSAAEPPEANLAQAAVEAPVAACTPVCASNTAEAATPVQQELAAAGANASMASRLAAQRRARSAARSGARRRSKQYAPSRPLGQPVVSLVEACEQQEREDAEARRVLMERFWGLSKTNDR
jgi:hypothetical protein